MSEIRAIQQTNDYYLITTDDGFGFMQRKHVLAAIHDPLNDYEEIIIALCRKILGESITEQP